MKIKTAFNIRGTLRIIFICLILSSFSFIVIKAQENDDPEPDDPPAVCVADDLHIQDLDAVIGGASGELREEADSEVENDGIKMLISNDSTAPIDGVSLLIIDDFTTPVKTASQTHGAYVEEVVRSMVQASLVQQIDYADPMNANTLAAVNTALSSYLDIHDSDIVVINMSWIILECKIEFSAYLSTNTGVEFVTLTIDIPVFYSVINNFDSLSLCSDIEEPEGWEDSLACNALFSYFGEEDYTTLVDSVNKLNDFDAGTINLIDFFLLINDLDLTAYNFLTVRHEIIDSLHQLVTAENTTILEFQRLLSRDNVLPIAAAGNFNLEPMGQHLFNLTEDAGGNGRRDAFSPANWDNVLAVSGVYQNSPTVLWAQSNDGQVAAVAAWYEFSTGEFGSGTSFSTPFVSGSLTNYIVDNIVNEPYRHCQFQNLLNLHSDDNLPFPAAMTLFSLPC